jgi:hypothetical protein
VSVYQCLALRFSAQGKTVIASVSAIIGAPATGRIQREGMHDSYGKRL